MITTHVTINLTSQVSPQLIQAVQGDTGRSICFKIADFTIPAGAAATYYIQKPSGEAIYNSATISGNEITCELTAQSLAEIGENPMQVRISADGEIVTSFDAILLVRPFRGIDAIESSTEINIFDQAVEQAAEDFQEQAEHIVEEVIESIPADYTALTEEVDELNERLSHVIPQFATRTEIANSSFNKLKSAWINGSGTSSTTILENIPAQPGDKINFLKCSVSATVNPSNLSTLTLRVIEYNEGGTVEKRTFIPSDYQTVTISSNVVKFDVVVYYEYSGVSTGYYEYFEGFLAITNGNTTLLENVVYNSNNIDSSPVQNSQKLITSGGVYDTTGNKSALNTADKSSIVSAVNEIDANEKNNANSIENVIPQIVSRTDVVNDNISASARIYNSSGTSTSSAIVFENIAVTPGEILTVLIADVKAMITPSNFTAVLPRIIEYDSNDSVVKRTFVSSGDTLTISSSTVKINVVIYVEYGVVNPAYYEQFTGYCSIISGDMTLSEFVKLPDRPDGKESSETLKANDLYYYDGLVRRCYNPYKNKGSNVLSGQLHCHIRFLDGGVIKYYNNGDMPTAMANYKSSGYDFLTITDYGHTGQITAPTSEDLPTGLIWMFDSCEADFSGSGDVDEKPPRHMCVYNTDEPLTYQNNWMTAQDFADLMKPTGKIITLAHPFYVGTYQKPSVVQQIEERVRFCEVYNGLCAWHQAEGDNWIIVPTGKDTDYAWETMLDGGLVVWGTAVSDAHSTTGISDIKNGCVKVYCNENADRFEILKNLCLGKFYSVSNIDVSLLDVSLTDGVYSVTVSDANAVIEFLKEEGTVLSSTTGATASYTMHGNEKYVRARITLSNGEKIWTQPIINIYEPDYDNYFDYSLM